MHREDKSFQTGLSEQGVEALKRQLVDLVEPLSDGQLLELADGIHEMLRQRRMVRRHHAERMQDLMPPGVDMLV